VEAAPFLIAAFPHPTPTPPMAQESLGEDFARVQATFLVLEGDSPPSVPALLDCVGVATRCSRAIRELGIMSKNERVEDMNTEDLKYLLVDFYHAALLQQVHGPGVGGPLQAAQCPPPPTPCTHPLYIT
jgi:hypothetical protein